MRLADSPEDLLVELLDEFERRGFFRGEYLNVISNDSKAASFFYSFVLMAMLFSITAFAEIMGEDATLKEVLEKFKMDEPNISKIAENKNGLFALFGEMSWRGVKEYYETFRDFTNIRQINETD